VVRLAVALTGGLVAIRVVTLGQITSTGATYPFTPPASGTRLLEFPFTVIPMSGAAVALASVSPGQTGVCPADSRGTGSHRADGSTVGTHVARITFTGGQIPGALAGGVVGTVIRTLSP